MPKKKAVGVPDLDAYLGKNRRTLCSYIEAVEIYPKEYERTCSEGVYHLWLLSNNTVIPFGLNRSRMKVVSRNRKRNPVGFVAEMARMMGIK